MLSYVQDHLWQVLLVANYSLVVVVSVLIVLKNSNPVKTLSYLFALATLPLIGLIVYYLFGQDYRKNKIFTRKYFQDDSRLREWREKFKPRPGQRTDFRATFGEGMFKIFKLLENNEKALLTFDNAVDILINGEAKFQRLKEDLQKATKHIHLEYFVIRDDSGVLEILRILCDKAQNGVSVRLIYDDVGSRLAAKTKQMLSNSGVKHYPFMPVRYPRFTSKLNYRDHRKIVVIDGTTGYVGGINLSSKYDNGFEENTTYWRDTHLRIQGPAVGSLQASFLLSWNFVSEGQILMESSFFPENKTEKLQPVAVQVVSSGPDTDWANIMEAIFTAINTAREYVYISTPYLIPNEAILTGLSTAARSGVDVRVIIPYNSDSWVAQYATDSYIEKLLQSKVRVYRYKKGFIHAKSMVIDDVFTSIGTANLDYRSFSINFEINALLYSQQKAKEMKAIFREDIQACTEVDPGRWAERGMKQKMQESFNRLWAPLL